MTGVGGGPPKAKTEFPRLKGCLAYLSSVFMAVLVSFLAGMVADGVGAAEWTIGWISGVAFVFAIWIGYNIIMDESE